MDLCKKEVAELLNVTESKIDRWIAEGVFPFYQINGNYRFSRMEVEDWVMRGKQEEPSLAAKGIKQYGLYRALHKGAVLHSVPGNTKEELIANVMKVSAGELGVDADVVTEMLMDRERLQSTGINNGIALPHTRESFLSPRQDSVIVAFPERPIDYDSLDGEPVHTLFFLFASDDKKHLHLLSKIAHLTSMTETRELLKEKPNKMSLLEYVRSWEAALGAKATSSC
ncbi:MAG: PTS sugar transporter subunit IIA [Chlamydiia bacterium]|nr:PTS sugar transporter subunit IIA [Chlamydiia bacterium]